MHAYAYTLFYFMSNAFVRLLMELCRLIQTEGSGYEGERVWKYHCFQNGDNVMAGGIY